jgi:hypothetical protein
MLTTRLTLVLGAVLALGACNRMSFEKIPAGQIDQKQKAFAEQWATMIMTSWEKGEYPQVGQEATREFRAGHNQIERQKTAHKYVRTRVGKFQSLAFYEALRIKPAGGVVYRFKGDFERGEGEIRVVFDPEGKLNGHWIKPWRDEMN